MTNSHIYAVSIYDIAKNEGISQAINDDMRFAAETFKEFPEYVKILDSAAISADDKNKIVDEAFCGRIHTYVLNLIKILAGRFLISDFSYITNDYENLYNKDNNIEKITVTSANELTDDEKERLIHNLSEKHGKKFIPEYKTDKSLLGGMIIDFENSRTDASIKSQLNKLKELIS